MGVLNMYTMYIPIIDNEIKLWPLVPMVAEFWFMATKSGFIHTEIHFSKSVFSDLIIVRPKHNKKCLIAWRNPTYPIFGANTIF